MIGRDIVADLENDLCLYALGQCVAVGYGLYVRAVNYLKIFCFLGRSGLVDEIVVYFKMIGHGDVRSLAEGSRVCQHARESGGRSDLGADEIDAGVRSAGASLKVAVEGAQGDGAGVRRLTHAYARTARALKQSCARAENVGECAVLGEHSENLHGAGGDSEADARSDALALENSRHLEHVVERGVRAGAYADLVDFYLAYFRNFLNIVGHMGHSREGLEGVEIYVDDLVVNRIVVRLDLDPVLLSALSGEESLRHFVGGKNGGRCAELRAHVGYGCTLGDGKSLDSVSAVFDYLAHAALDGHYAQNLENYIFCADPRRKCAVQVYACHLGHSYVVCAAAHRNRDVESARAEREHTYAATGRSVAVGADKRLAGDAEALKMHLMADAVAGA